jgi:hypothetical protein
VGVMSTTVRRVCALLVLGAVFLGAACGSSTQAPASATAAVSASAAPSATVGPTSSLASPSARTASPSTAPASPSASPDVAAQLRIGSPYTLVVNPANTQLSGSMTFDLAGQHVAATIAGREIRQAGVLVGLAIVERFAGMRMTAATFDGAAKGAAGMSGGKLTYGRIFGQRVAYVTTGQGVVGMYPLGQAIVMVSGTKPADTPTLLGSVILANR